MKTITAILSSVGIVLFGLALGVGADRDGSGPVLGIEQLRQDYDLFRHTLEEGQPGIYRYTPKQEMDRIFSQGRDQITRPMDTLDFYRVLAPVFASLKDGHGELFPSPNVTAAIDKSVLPFDVRVIDGKVYVLHDFSSERNALAGEELESVNSVQVETILNKMLQVQPGDANGQTTRPYRIGHDNGFRRMLYPLFGIQAPYRIRYHDGSAAETKEVQVDGIAEARLKSLAKSRYGPPPSPLHDAGKLDFVDNGKIAVLKINGFGGMAGNIFTPLGKFIDSSFRKINDKGTHVLIIDVRDNDGGVPELGEQLFSYLADKPFLYYKDLILNARSFSFFPYADSSKPIPDNLVKMGADGKYHHTGHHNWGTQQPREPHFAGRVLVLMNGGSFSVTAEFLSMTKSLTKATLIGEESAGAYQGNNSGLKYDITLPNSKIVMRIPVVSHYMAVAEDMQSMDRGVLPDHPVHYSIAEMVNGTDKEMDIALQLARSSN